MTRPMRARTGVVVGLTAVAGTVLSMTSPWSAEAGNNSTPAPVTVTNSSSQPVPITGTVGLNSSANTVKLDPSSSVKDGDQTSVIASGDHLMTDSDQFFVTPKIDTSGVREVRVIVSCPSSPGSCSGTMTVFAVAGTTSAQVATATIDQPQLFGSNNGATVEVQDPGMSIVLLVVSNGPNDLFQWTVAGRAN